MKQLTCLLGFAIALLCSCKRNLVHAEINKENIVGTWQLTSKLMSATGIPEQDAYLTMSECEKDDLFVFRADDVLVYMDSGMICDYDGSAYGLWSISQEQITFFAQIGNITRFDGDHMEITVKVTTPDTVYMTRWILKRVS